MGRAEAADLAVEKSLVPFLNL